VSGTSGKSTSAWERVRALSRNYSPPLRSSLFFLSPPTYLSIYDAREEISSYSLGAINVRGVEEKENRRDRQKSNKR
jgi:hypothetical protein